MVHDRGILLQFFMPDIHTFDSSGDIGIVFESAAVHIAVFGEGYIHPGGDCSCDGI